MRRFTTLLSLLILVVGCSSRSDSGDIAFEHVFSPFNMPADTSALTATGVAIDNDLFCSAATGTFEGLEGEDGATRLPEDFEALLEAEELFVNVAVESMTCDDGSGEFTLRRIDEIDPSLPGAERLTDSSWTITGGSGYDTTSGKGDTEGPHAAGDGDSLLYNGTGTITKD